MFCRSRTILGKMSELPTPKIILNSSKAYPKTAFIQQLRNLSSSPATQNQADNDVLARYKEKLQKKAEVEGVKNIEDLKEKYKGKIDETKKELNSIDPFSAYTAEVESTPVLSSTTFTSASSENADPTPAQKKQSGSPVAPLPKPNKGTLDTFVDVEKISLHNAKEIELIWRARHAETKKSLCAILEPATFERLYKTSRQNPMFVLPLPREGQGIEMHFAQWSFINDNTVHCLITTLGDFQLHGEYAKPHTTIMLHTDLADSKNIVLMNGAVEADSHITAEEGQFLVFVLQKFYGAINSDATGARRAQMLRDFTAGSSNFNVDLLIEEAQNMS
ncbi:ATP11-domain-containing protein [Nadsonia fulvescens var. elongata DSM 6958]|uniref:ATP11-domain-containing protein n=1 Tax=Nadsonia fulvescens var. elongata DSM 6958 TaxID=857566 RepID=A0A1E3PRB0_9ASCO|nr:ATP11-domain-containing protein [Nadsonia fulvescens var. elongata DSM 6958]